MNWQFIAGIAIGVAIVEYYRRVIDRIRQEQIADQRARCRMHSDQPRRRRDDLISQEQYDEYRATGHTAGRYQGENAR